MELLPRLGIKQAPSCSIKVLASIKALLRWSQNFKLIVHNQLAEAATGIVLEKAVPQDFAKLAGKHLYRSFGSRLANLTKH